MEWSCKLFTLDVLKFPSSEDGHRRTSCGSHMEGCNREYVKSYYLEILIQHMPKIFVSYLLLCLIHM